MLPPPILYQVCRRLVPTWTKGCYRLAAARLALKQYEDAALAGSYLMTPSLQVTLFIHS